MKQCGLSGRMSWVQTFVHQKALFKLLHSPTSAVFGKILNFRRKKVERTCHKSVVPTQCISSPRTEIEGKIEMMSAQ